MSEVPLYRWTTLFRQPNPGIPRFPVQRCPPRQKSGVERLKAKQEPLLTQVTLNVTKG